MVQAASERAKKSAATRARRSKVRCCGTSSLGVITMRFFPAWRRDIDNRLTARAPANQVGSLQTLGARPSGFGNALSTRDSLEDWLCRPSAADQFHSQTLDAEDFVCPDDGHQNRLVKMLVSPSVRPVKIVPLLVGH